MTRDKEIKKIRKFGGYQEFSFNTKELPAKQPSRETYKKLNKD